MAKYKLKRHYEPKKDSQNREEYISERQWWAIEKVAAYLEHSRLNDYIALIEKPGRWIRINLMGGIARGIGIAIGFTLLGAIGIILLQQVVTWNLPGISDFIAQILDMVEKSRGLKP
ncbi:MAG: DUF5665 domain-containing protein [Clostridiales bacterium]